MPIIFPTYTKNELNKAGVTLITPNASDEETEKALTVINNWRSMHSFPLNTFQKYLRRKVKEIDTQSLVAQRIKRLSSIEAKLLRFPKMNFARMQDIGGCRAVVKSVAHVNNLVKLYQESEIKHKLEKMDNYIETPKISGYQGVHLVYKYFSDRRQTYNGLSIEMQFRSPLMHAWATAVETVGTFIQQALKSSQGEEEWLRFFSLMGSAIALREHTQLVPNTPIEKNELKKELRDYIKRLNVHHRLNTFGAALETLGQPTDPKAYYYLLELNPTANSVTVRSYRYKELERASNDYLAAERLSNRQSGTDAVLVSVDSMAALRKAYPNYFLDTAVFLEAVTKATS